MTVDLLAQYLNHKWMTNGDLTKETQALLIFPKLEWHNKSPKERTSDTRLQMKGKA